MQYLQDRAARSVRRTNRVMVVAAAALILAAGAVFGYARSPGFRRAGRIVLYRLYSATARMAQAKASVRLEVPFHRQEHALSCEAAALTMVLRYYDVAVTESELLQKMPYATRAGRSKENIWGDPEIGFVGDVDGTIPNNGYGVYEEPIAALAQKYRPARAIINGTLSEILDEVAQQRPVIVWGSLASGRNISWVTPEGKQVKAVYGEHARVVIGFSGTPDNPTSVYLLDPVYGAITMSKQKFLNNWALLDNRAVVVE